MRHVFDRKAALLLTDKRFATRLLGVTLLIAAAGGSLLLAHAKRTSGALQALALGYAPQGGSASIDVKYPLPETVFPQAVPPPRFFWADTAKDNRRWVIRLLMGDRKTPLIVPTKTPFWTPSRAQWDNIQKVLREAPVSMSVLGVSLEGRPRITSAAAELTLRGSSDPVDGVLFYREVKPPFLSASEDLSRVRWRCGSISNPSPPVVLANPVVCGNCHSFSRDGRWMGMDFDYRGDKSAYAIVPTQGRMDVQADQLIHWDTYASPERFSTTGLASQVSPDGRYVVASIKELFVSLPINTVAQSLIFFPIKGILVVYDREQKTIRALPGADNPAYVQCNPAWSPDGRQIVFARADAVDAPVPPSSFFLSPRDGWAFMRTHKEYRYDLYTIPFNEGRGGPAQPLRGASRNGMSNSFPKYSPDGRWIVFCQAKNYLFLQPDSQLYIVPAEGGEARKMRCNLKGMNSWHSWSPNGRWLVFTSNAFSPYTQLFLTHIDQEGNSSPAVALPHLTDPEWAINVPEFMASDAPVIERITLKF